MTHEEYAERLAEWGMGWLGWTEEELNRTTLPAIETAWRGKCAMLKAVFGGGDKEKPKRKPTPEQIKEGLSGRGRRKS